MPNRHLKNCGGTPRTCPFCLNWFIDPQASLLVQTFCSEECLENFHVGTPHPNAKDSLWIG